MVPIRAYVTVGIALATWISPSVAPPKATTPHLDPKALQKQFRDLQKKKHTDLLLEFVHADKGQVTATLHLSDAEFIENTAEVKFPLLARTAQGFYFTPVGDEVKLKYKADKKNYAYASGKLVPLDESKRRDLRQLIDSRLKELEESFKCESRPLKATFPYGDGKSATVAIKLADVKVISSFMVTFTMTANPAANVVLESPAKPALLIYHGSKEPFEISTSFDPGFMRSVAESAGFQTTIDTIFREKDLMNVAKAVNCDKIVTPTIDTVFRRKALEELAKAGGSTTTTTAQNPSTSEQQLSSSNPPTSNTASSPKKLQEGTTADQAAEQHHQCFNVIQKIATYDEKFTHRPELKIEATEAVEAEQGIAGVDYDEHKFSEYVNKFIKLDGLYNHHKSTADWVMDVMRGTQNEKDAAKAKAFNGQEIQDLFKEHAADKHKKDHLLFHLQLKSGIGGDHELVVEQFPGLKDADPPRYRIYQSREGAYSLEPWLTPKDGDKKKRDEHIYVNLRTKYGTASEEKCQKDDVLLGYHKQYTACLKQVDDVLGKRDKLPSTANVELLTKYRDFVKGASVEQSKKDFEMAWSRYGQGKGPSLSMVDLWDGKESFIGRLTDYLAWLNSKDDKDHIVSQEMFDRYKELFGATLTTVFPGLPRDLTRTVGQSVLRIKVHKLHKTGKELGQYCEEEGRRIAGGLLDGGTKKSVPMNLTPKLSSLPKNDAAAASPTIEKTCALAKGVCKAGYHIACEKNGRGIYQASNGNALVDAGTVELCKDQSPPPTDDELQVALPNTVACYTDNCEDDKLAVCVKITRNGEAIWVPVVKAFKRPRTEAPKSKVPLEAAMLAKLDFKRQGTVEFEPKLSKCTRKNTKQEVEQRRREIDRIMGWKSN